MRGKSIWNCWKSGRFPAVTFPEEVAERVRILKKTPKEADNMCRELEEIYMEGYAEGLAEGIAEVRRETMLCSIKT